MANLWTLWAGSAGAAPPCWPPRQGNIGTDFTSWILVAV